MWDKFKPEEIAAEDRIIDKLGLVKDFLDADREIRLTSPEKLSNWLRQNRSLHTFGVYCIYNSKKKEVLYVGKSVNVKTRIRGQLIGSKSRKTGLLQFTRLFFGVLSREKDMTEKVYNEMSDVQKRELIRFYQGIIFKANNVLRVCLTEDDIKAIVLENTLIRYFSGKGQCKYNFLK